MFEDAPKIQVAKQQDFLVLEENWAAINLFLKCQTQWVYLSSMNGAIRTGLNYQAVETVMRLSYPDEDPVDLFNRLQVIEREALNIFSEDS